MIYAFVFPLRRRTCLRKMVREYALGIPQALRNYRSITMAAHSIAWKQIKPAPDSEHGSPCARSSHSVEYTKSGTLYILGGEHVARTPLQLSQFVWALSTDKPSWRMVPIKGEDFSSRVAHASAYCPVRDKIYMFGGRVGIAMNETSLNDMWSFDVATECWSEVKASNTLPEARSFHKMVCMDEKLYLFGGCGKSGRLADLHMFDTSSLTWTDLGSSALRGRGGASLIPLPHVNKLAVIAGFAGEEMCDGQIYDLSKNKWDDEKLTKLESQLRPRSVCISGLIQSQIFLFGGEVDPSHKGHDGAGGFEGDIVFISDDGENVLERFASKYESKDEAWPESRGWGDGSVGTDGFWIFGGLAGDDAKPRRLDDLWFCSYT